MHVRRGFCSYDLADIFTKEILPQNFITNYDVSPSTSYMINEFNFLFSTDTTQ